MFSTLHFISLMSPDSCLNFVHTHCDIRLHWWLGICNSAGPIDHINLNGDWVFLLGDTHACGQSCNVCYQGCLHQPPIIGWSCTRPPWTWFYHNFSILFIVALLPFLLWSTVFTIFTTLWQNIFEWSVISLAVHMQVLHCHSMLLVIKTVFAYQVPNRCHSLCYKFHWTTFSHLQSEMDYSHWSILLHGHDCIACTWQGEAPGLLTIHIPRFCHRKCRCHADLYTHKVSSDHHGFMNKF
jgi:hypothetical protein